MLFLLRILGFVFKVHCVMTLWHLFSNGITALITSVVFVIIILATMALAGGS